MHSLVHLLRRFGSRRLVYGSIFGLILCAFIVTDSNFAARQAASPFVVTSLAVAPRDDLPRTVWPLRNPVCSDCNVSAVKPATDTMASRAPVHAPMPEPPFEVPARAVAIFDLGCEGLVYGKQEHRRLAPASLTKIVTALAAIEHIDLEKTVTAKVSALQLMLDTDSSVMGLEPGLEVSAEDLLYGLFLPSGNDAAIELAELAGKSQAGFVDLMNAKARELGLLDSHFSNPHGLDSTRLYSTAFDMALAGIALLENPTLAAISNAPSYALEGGLSFKNGNRLLESYPGAYGVKIGFTDAAKGTIVAAAESDGRRLLISVLGSDDLYTETAELLDWAFESTTLVCGS